jgi:hypothetical protein
MSPQDPYDPIDEGEGSDDYRLPPEIFSDPFEPGEGGEPPQHDIFLPSFLGIEEESQAAAESTVPEGHLSLRQRFDSAVQQMRKIREEGDRFAGADTSAPPPWWRLHTRKAESVVDAGAVAVQVGTMPADPFERLLTPLTDPAISQLQAEIEADEAIFVRYERSRKAQLRQHGVGLIFAVIVLILFLLFSRHGTWDAGLIRAKEPGWLSRRLGIDRAGGLLFGLGLLLPFLTLGALSDTFVFLLRATARRSPFDLFFSIISACFALSTLILVAQALPLQAAGTLLAWFVFRLLVNLVTGFRR